MITIKKCDVCRIPKLLDEFYKHPDTSDGLAHLCKVCHRQRMVAHRRDNESVREYDRRRAKTPARRSHAAQVGKLWRQRHPDRYRAQNAVNNALRDGKIDRSDACQKCGAEKILHAHHADYSRPLDVVWLCARCHHVGHAQERVIMEAAS